MNEFWIIGPVLLVATVWSVVHEIRNLRRGGPTLFGISGSMKREMEEAQRSYERTRTLHKAIEPRTPKEAPSAEPRRTGRHLEL